MEIETQLCECGATHDICGNCGSRKVTPIDHINNDVTTSLKSVVLGADDGDEITVKSVCWDCGATCERTLDVSVEHN